MRYDALFSGELFSTECGPSGRTLIKNAQALIEEILGEEPERLASEEFRVRLQECRTAVQSLRPQAVGLLAELGISGAGVMMDQLRLRAITPGLDEVERAAPVFYAHRDTWYGNPACQINVWLPLHSVDSHNSFRFYLDYFETTIRNDSERFLADSFRGFGSLQPVGDEVYPRTLTDPIGTVYEVSMKEGEVLLFSAAHLHQTLPNRTTKTRFSLDFRFFLQEHLEAGLGAPDRDNRSQGLMTGEYVACG